MVLEHGFQPPKKSTGVGVRECLGYFIAMLRGYTSQAMDDRFQRSGGTISKHIKKITPALEDFAAKWVAPLQRHEHWRPYLERSKKYCHFKDCIGAVDGTHIPCNPPREKAANYWSRKGMHTFNVLAVVDFNLCFTFAVTGYEGAMHDYQIFKEETMKTNNWYPHPPPGKYYLVDAGYPNAKGYLAPYKGYMYHQDEFMRRSVPVTDSNEVFNKAHSSLRSCVERSFSVLKKRYPFLKTPSEYGFQEAKKFILIAMGLHNYIRWHYPSDEYFRVANMSNEDYVSEDSTTREICQQEMGDGPHFAQMDWEMDRFRDELRDTIASDYRRRNQCGRAR